MTPLAPFGWQQDAPPDLNATNLEANRAQIAAYGEAFASAAASAAQAAAQAASLPTTQKGAANGVATLDGSKRLPTAQLPTSVATDIAAGVATAEAASDPLGSAAAVAAQKGAANGIATLDGTSKLTGSQLPTSVGTSIAAAIATAEAASDPVGSAASAAAGVLAQKGAANGIASLDGESHLPSAQLPPGAGQSKSVDLGSSLSGNITLNLAAGSVFHGSLTADADLHTLTGAVAGVAQDFFVRIKTNGHKLTASFTDEWLQGSEPGQEAMAAIDFLTEDGGETIYGFGVAGIPSQYAQYGAIAAGQFATYNAATGKLDGGTPPSGVSPGALAAAIAELGLPNFAGQYNAFPLSDESGVIHYELFPERVLLLAQGRLKPGAVVTATKTLPEVVDVVYRITKKAITLTMPTGFVAPYGGLIVLINDSEGAVKVSGRFTPGSESSTTLELEPGDSTWFMWEESSGHWRRVARAGQGGDARVPNINTTTNKTSNQITKAFEAAFSPEKPPRDGSLAVDNTNHLLLEYNLELTKWFKTAVLTEIT